VTRPEPLTVLYDADCGFCRWSVARLLAVDRAARLRPAAIQSGEGEVLLAGIPAELRLASAHVVAPGGAVTSGADALATVAAALPGATVTAPVARAAAPLSRVAYRLVAGNRTTLGRLVSPGMRRAADERIAARRALAGWPLRRPGKPLEP
jgi:predicted DCC family thiol-disulfide oxidoreductase YuxK